MRRKYLPRWAYAEVEWNDAAGDAPSSSSWRPVERVAEESHGPAHIVSVGHVIRDDYIGILLCLSRQDQEVDSHIFVPAAYISRVRKLR